MLSNRQIYANIASKGGPLLSSALDALLPATVSADSTSLSGSPDTLFAVSTTTLPRRELAKIPLSAARALSDAAVQPSRDEDGSAYVVLEVGEEGGLLAESKTSDEVEKAGWNVRGEFCLSFVRYSSVLILTSSLCLTARRTEDDMITLSTDQLVVVITSEGRLTSIFDKGAERELLIEGETAGFVIFEDTPLNWDAWDVGKLRSPSFDTETRDLTFHCCFRRFPS